MTVGMPARLASPTTWRRPVLSSGARTMPSTPREIMSSMTEICWPRSSSTCGPFQTISTLRSPAAFSAPAWMDFQYSWVVPIGMTATVRRDSSGDGPPWQPKKRNASPARAAGSRRRCRGSRVPSMVSTDCSVQCPRSWESRHAVQTGVRSRPGIRVGQGQECLRPLFGRTQRSAPYELGGSRRTAAGGTACHAPTAASRSSRRGTRRSSASCPCG